MKKRLTILWCCLSLVVTGTVPAWCTTAQTPWPMFQHDIYHTGQSSSYGLQIQKSQQKFAKSLGVTGIGAPVVDADGTIYICGENSCLYALGADGSAQCIFDGIDGPVEATPVLSSEGILYIPTVAGSLHAVGRDGTHHWTLHVDQPLLSSPVIGPDKRLFFGSGNDQTKTNGFLYCVSSEGELLWEYPTGATGYISPAIDQYGTVVIASPAGTVYAFDPDGDLLWSYDAPEGITASPVVGTDETIYITTPLSLRALDFSGMLKRDPFIPRIVVFDELTDSGFAASPAVDAEGNLYIGGILGDVYSLDRTGAERWSPVLIKGMTLMDPMPVPILAAPIIDRKGRVYVRSGNYIASFSGKTGEVFGLLKFIEHERNQSSAAESSPVFGLRRTLLLPFSDGTLYALSPKQQVLNVTGTITGDIIEGIKVFAKALDETLESYETKISTTGAFAFQDLYPGSYIITPVRQGVQFTPPARTVRLGFADLSGVDFSAALSGAVIENAQATPAKIQNNTSSPVLFTAKITHALGQSHIASVTIDLSPLNGNAQQPLHDDGTGGDSAPSDSIYSCSAVVPSSVSIQLAPLMVTATDTDGRVTQAIIPLEIFNEISGSGDNTYELFYEPTAQCNATQCGNAFTIQYQLEGNENQSRAHQVKLLAQSSIPVLQVFSPSNTSAIPDYERPLQQVAQKIRITNAQAGVWRYRVLSQGASNVQYNVTTSTAGTGIILGTVTDAQTGAPVEQALVSTTIGGSTKTQNGYYVLLSPAGVITITAVDQAHAPASLSVSVMAGGTAEVNFLLLPQGSGTSGTCPVETALGSNTTVLDRIRLFRDRVLPMTGYADAVSRYYGFAPEILSCMADDVQLRTDIAHAVLVLLPTVEQMLAGNPGEFTHEQTKTMLGVLGRLRKYAEPSLAAEIDRLMDDIRSGAFFKKLNTRAPAHPERWVHEMLDTF